MSKKGFPPGVHLVGGRNAAPVHRQQAREFYAPILPLVKELKARGLSLRQIAAELDRRGVRTRMGSWWSGYGPDAKETVIRWSAAQVMRVLAMDDGPATATDPAPPPL